MIRRPPSVEVIAHHRPEIIDFCHRPPLLNVDRSVLMHYHNETISVLQYRGSMSSSAGRPRDPDVDQRVTRAALDLFGENGWAGFNIEAVARRAHVGKASIYRRWSTRDALLVAAVREVVALAPSSDSGDLRTDLRALARHLLHAHLRDGGKSMMRLRFEAPEIPELREQWEAIRRSEVDAARRLIHGGIRRGDLPRETPVTLVLDTLCGAALMHAIARPDDVSPASDDEIEGYVDDLVTFVLAGIHAATS